MHVFFAVLGEGAHGVLNLLLSHGGSLSIVQLGSHREVVLGLLLQAEGTMVLFHQVFF